MDKSAWGDGPWQDEPDKVQWVDEATGLDCLAVRHTEWGHWCGYVGVPRGHRFYDAEDDAEDVLSVHGGITFGSTCQEDAEEGHGVCHVPYPGRPDDIFWLGFDCGHAFDLQPGMDAEFKSIVGRPSAMSRIGEYRTIEYVRENCARLARQLAEA